MPGYGAPIDRERGGSNFLCPECLALTSVAETRRTEGGVTVRRRRVCREGHQFWTREDVVDSRRTPFVDAARDGNRVPEL
jgi:transcriptional regulator NrdR family protein